MLPSFGGVGAHLPDLSQYRGFLINAKPGLIHHLYADEFCRFVVWMLFTFFKDMPKDILRRPGRMDGASTLQEVFLFAVTADPPGIASTAFAVAFIF